MIKINTITEPVCSLFGPNDELIGEISSLFSLNDVRIQIMQQKLKGYYIITGKYERIEIDKNGNLDWWPKGFYDLIDDQMMTLLDWQ